MANYHSTGHLDRAYILLVPMHQCSSSLCSSLLRWYATACLTDLIKLAQDVHTDLALSGLAESSFYPGMQYVIGSWYRRDELAKRSCIFHVSSAIATMCSGYLMAAVYHLGGRGGFAGWQW